MISCQGGHGVPGRRACVLVGRGKSVQLILKCLHKQMKGRKKTQLERGVILWGEKKNHLHQSGSHKINTQPVRLEQVISNEQQHMNSYCHDQGRVADGQASVAQQHSLSGGWTRPPLGFLGPRDHPLPLPAGARMQRHKHRLQVSGQASAPEPE